MPRSLIWIFAVCLTIAIGLAWWFARDPIKMDGAEYMAIIREAARKYDVDPLLIQAVCWRESRFRPKVAGNHGERGLMQVTEGAAAHWVNHEDIQNFRPTDLFDPRTNIMAGTYYLHWNLIRWKDTDEPEVFALAAYNAGPSKARAWAKGEARSNAAAFINAIAYPMTRNYVTSVLERRELYRQQALE